ncbi:alpha/beta fold hydrolase [Bradyrhizobium arachidis]|uniref:alpha/beta fold hydrolase n=1 Tax=Bradyrhizobium arachidis TaxID=858423 RepID=UPI0021617161|nr:alpha/beta fold hydrolase [Bradyrhizobium arachidis]UVO28361.1 alpha/beta fold hydrolase [Bradyrhizobium arachidis]
MWLTYLGVAGALVLIGLVCLNYVFPEFTAGWLLALRLKAGGFADKRISIPGFNIVYWEAGGGEPLVLVHGMGVDRGTMLDVAEKLKQNYRVILLDLPGFGDSDKPDNADYGIKAQVENLRQFIQALDLRRVHLAGHSMGGWISAGFAATHPDMVSTLWLIAAAGTSDLEDGIAMEAFRRGEYVLCCRAPSDLPGIMKLAMVKVPRLPHFLWEALGRRAAANYDLHKRIFKTIADDVAGYDLERRLPGIAAPTLLVWGDSDRLVPPSALQTFKRLIPGARAILMEQIGHVPQMEAVDRCANDYIAFRQSVPASAD